MLPLEVFFRQINDVNWSAEYVQHVLLQSRTMVYGLCFTGWPGPRKAPGKRHPEPPSLSSFFFPPFCLRFLFNTLVLMKYPSGSAVRGFSLGATAG